MLEHLLTVRYPYYAKQFSIPQINRRQEIPIFDNAKHVLSDRSIANPSATELALEVIKLRGAVNPTFKLSSDIRYIFQQWMSFQRFVLLPPNRRAFVVVPKFNAQRDRKSVV